MTTYKTPSTWDESAMALAAGTLEEHVHDLNGEAWDKLGSNDVIQPVRGLKHYRIRCEPQMLLVPRERLQAEMESLIMWRDIDAVALALRKILLESPVQPPSSVVAASEPPEQHKEAGSGAKAPGKAETAAEAKPLEFWANVAQQATIVWVSHGYKTEEECRSIGANTNSSVARHFREVKGLPPLSDAQKVDIYAKAQAHAKDSPDYEEYFIASVVQQLREKGRLL